MESRPRFLSKMPLLQRKEVRQMPEKTLTVGSLFSGIPSAALILALNGRE